MGSEVARRGQSTVATRSIHKRVLKELAYEDADAIMVERKMANSAQLAEESIDAITHIDSKITSRSEGKPGLEMQLRDYQNTLHAGMVDRLYKYIHS